MQTLLCSYDLNGSNINWRFPLYRMILKIPKDIKSVEQEEEGPGHIVTNNKLISDRHLVTCDSLTLG